MLLFVATYSIGSMALGWLPQPYEVIRIPLMCGAIACVGGCVYCLRAIYLNKSVRKTWDPAWHTWYFLRPLTSLASGTISYLFLKAGLLVLESKTSTDSSDYGFFALAFIAGFNVDKFLAKIEDVARAVWGIEKTRASNFVADEKDDQKADQKKDGISATDSEPNSADKSQINSGA